MLQPHIQLDEALNIRYAILPGDPARVSRIAAQMENTEEIVFNREYRSLKGVYKGVPILAMSTGMGGASMAIAVEELKNIGVNATIKPVEWEAWLEDVYANSEFESTVVGVDASNLSARAMLELL